MKIADKFHLTYCSNIHPGESWEEVRRNLQTYVRRVRERVCPGEPFAVGLRVSAQAAEALNRSENLQWLREFLSQERFYVFTINGFPYGTFHHARIKDQVYLPDWREEARLSYSNQLAKILTCLLPSDAALEGSISTVPVAFKDHIRTRHEVSRMAEMLLRHVSCLFRLLQETGRTIALALEPEPCCYLETIDETVTFFQEELLTRQALRSLVLSEGVTLSEAEEAVRSHLGVCYDACHIAVEFEEPVDAVRKLSAAGIKICKFHISSAPRLEFREGDSRPQEAFQPFVEDTYLHQVVERSPAGLVRYRDLPEALSRGKGNGAGAAKEWRVHFHVPIFLSELQHLQTTQDHLMGLFDLLREDPVCPYLEVETYTWEVLPPEYQKEDVTEAVARELNWVCGRIVL